MTVPVYERREQLKALPGGRMSAPGGAEAHGAGVAAAFGRLAERGMQIAEDIEDTRTLEAFNAFKRDVSQYHHDPGKGVLNRLGKETIGLYSEAETWMDKRAEEYIRKMGSPRMVQNFRKLAGQTILSQGEQNSLHEAKQIRAYRQAESEAAIQTALGEAVKNWQNDGFFNESLETARQAYELQSRGLGDEARKAGLLELESRFAAGRLGAMIQADPITAEAWYKANKEKFTGEARVRAEAVLEKETKAYKLEIVRDDLIKRHGMNYAAARKEILEKYKGEEEQRALALYEGWYSDQKRIRDEAKQRADYNFFNKLQSFGSEAEAMDYLLKNANSMNRWREGKSFINWIFNGRRVTEDGALLKFESSLEKGKFDKLTPDQAKARLAPYFSQDDWKEIVEPALKERRSETKTHKQIVNTVIGNEISKLRQSNQDIFDADEATNIEREYKNLWKENPNMSA